MTRDSYIDAAIKTESPIDDRLRDRFHKRDNIRLLHACLGINSEIIELNKAISQNDIINIGEEILDIIWYCALACDVLDIDLIPSERDYNLNIIESGIIVNAASDISDIIKKAIFYGKEYSIKDIQFNICEIIKACINLCECYKLDFKELKRKNIEKLAARYGGKFSEERAINRDLQLEFKVLSK